MSVGHKSKNAKKQKQCYKRHTNGQYLSMINTAFSLLISHEKEKQREKNKDIVIIILLPQQNKNINQTYIILTGIRENHNTYIND